MTGVQFQAGAETISYVFDILFSFAEKFCTNAYAFNKIGPKQQSID
jgi:hypothetical protein